MDGTRGDSVQEVYVGERCLVHGDCVLGGDVVWGKTVLELVESGCDKEHRKRIQVRKNGTLHSKHSPFM